MGKIRTKILLFATIIYEYKGANICLAYFMKYMIHWSVAQQTMETRDEQNRTRVKSGNLSLSTAHHPTHAHVHNEWRRSSFRNMKQSSDVLKTFS